tara:strand:+ start:215 stop:433 length:219 start_codon:yes stop_codon:yes gene_type:complete
VSDIENYDWMGLLKGAVDVASNGFADDEVAQKRFEHCKGCVFFKKNSQCMKCGCIMNVKVKIKGASCPIGMW